VYLFIYGQYVSPGSAYRPLSSIALWSTGMLLRDFE